MATAAVINREITITSMADADLAGLEALFDEQCAEWLDLLKWDFKGPSMLIRDVARQRQLTGFAATRGNNTVALAYYLIEGPRCSIGDIYVSRPLRGVGIDRQMAAAVFDKLDRLGRVRRIESQYVGVDNDEADALFQARGFQRLERNYMMVDLNAISKTDGLNIEPGGVSIRPWKKSDFSQATRIIHRSYRDTYDSRINSQYRTEEGCSNLLTILTDSVWCGDFVPQVSRVAVRSTGTLAGVLIGSRVSNGVGHVGQISVHPASQGQGIGRQLLESALLEFRNRGFNWVTLAVTSANESAVHLYESCGFRTIHSFPVFYRDKR
ncbi:MAG TPA: GNAT family N-acetyltransferase [Blastocatellia bacterium]|nr:GNAT family N-acetyltransferase [Blastocatellia bacterium]